MSFIDQLLDRIFTPYQPLQAGVYHYQSPPDAETPLRMHLRIAPDGTGVLILNASTVLHLNQTATEYVYHMIKGTAEDEVIEMVAKRYQVSREQAKQDLHNIKERLEVLLETQDLDPETFLDFERREPYSSSLVSPYRLDCALTYAVTDGEPEKAAPVDRVKRELTTEEWKTVLQKAWDAGIPHVIFTGGEPTLRTDLPEIIAYAEHLGQVTGLLTNGLKFAEPDYLQAMLQSGLDHTMFILDPVDEQSWYALGKVMPEDLFTSVHLTISEDTSELHSILTRLTQLGVTSLSISASSAGYKEKIDEARQIAADNGLNLVWDLPVPYSRLNPVALELAEAGEAVQGAGHAWLYVEPDGDVLPSQGQQPVLGNLLTDAWDRIWKKE